MDLLLRPAEAAGQRILADPVRPHFFCLHRCSFSGLAGAEATDLPVDRQSSLDLRRLARCLGTHKSSGLLQVTAHLLFEDRARGAKERPDDLGHPQLCLKNFPYAAITRRVKR